MALTKPTKQLIDIMLPTTGAVIVGIILFSQKKKDWRIILIGLVVAFLLLYVLTTQITKRLYLAGPADVPNYAPGGQAAVDNFDPQSIMQAIHNDINCVWCLRDRTLYSQLQSLSDGQFIKAYNYWNDNYYADNKETLAQAIANESSFVDNQFGQQQSDLAARFSKLNLQ